LAVTLELKLNLEPLPKYKTVCALHFNSFLEAIGTVSDILRYQPAAVEIIDETVIKLSRENLTTRKFCHFINGDPGAILLVEFYDEDKGRALQRTQQMADDLKVHGKGYAYPIYEQGKEYDEVLLVRKKGLGLMMGMTGGPKPLAFIEDAAVPVEHLPAYIDQVVKICAKYGTLAAMYAHASVGLIHVRPILDLRKQEDIEKMKGIANEAFELVLKYGGSWSGEHGDGMVRSPFNRRFFGDQLYDAFRDVKKLFDPDNLMNPGKVVEAEPMDVNLKYGAEYKDQEVVSQFLYKAEGNFSEAVHMCTGVGECRKTIGGTMCPSFKATRDEEHSTRGRANALRMAMSNQLDDMGLASPRLHKALDLCLSCKACKSECPSNVDMAKMKSDVLQLYYDQHGAKLRDKMIRDSAQISSRFSGKLSGIINAIQHTSLFKSLLDSVSGFDKRRTLPDYAPEPFYKWFDRNARNQPKQDKQVVLFADTYLNFHEPNIGISAFELLSSCGYEVILANVGCCQRPKISHGFLRDAKKDGQKTIEKLKVYLSKGLNVVVCEPSCASALNEDLPDLIALEELSKQLKGQVMMIDVFLSKEMEAGRLCSKLQLTEVDISIHGHCHQKALYGTSTMKNCITSNGHSVEEIPSGCCGMAGSFGYEKEHYELSEKIGESILFPKVRSLKEGTTVVANGFSCRHQIEHFTGVKPKHWVEVVRLA
jgi:Fe-S oxidoreductase